MILVVLPLRLASIRVPRKILSDIEGKSLAARSVERTLNAFKGDSQVRVVAAVDDPESQNHLCSQFPKLEVILTDPAIASGTDRVFAALQKIMSAEPSLRQNLVGVINVQGDMPFVGAEGLRQVAGFLREKRSESAMWATLSQEWPNDQSLSELGAVKVLSDRQGRALYFSRFAIPHSRVSDQELGRSLAELHLGVYGFNLEGITQFCAHAPIDLERAESLEQLRALWLGIPIYVLRTEPAANESYRGVDFDADLQWARNWAKEKGR